MAKFNHLPIYVVLDNIRSLYNVGAIFRTSDGAGVAKLYLCGITGCPPRKEIEKTSLGAEKIVPFEWKKSTLRTVKDLKRKLKAQVVALEKIKGSVEYTKVNLKFPIILVIGNEVNGLSDKILEIADKIIHIPMRGIKESLNVATAYGIAAYEMGRKCQNAKFPPSPLNTGLRRAGKSQN